MFALFGTEDEESTERKLCPDLVETRLRRDDPSPNRGSLRRSSLVLGAGAGAGTGADGVEAAGLPMYGDSAGGGGSGNAWLSRLLLTEVTVFVRADSCNGGGTEVETAGLMLALRGPSGLAGGLCGGTGEEDKAPSRRTAFRGFKLLARLPRRGRDDDDEVDPIEVVSVELCFLPSSPD